MSEKRRPTALNTLGLDNSRYLLESGASLESAVNPSGEASLPAISISKLDRYAAISIASALTTHLDTGRPPRGRRQLQNDFDESMRLSREEDPLIFKRLSRDLRYKVLVGESEFGKYVLQAHINRSVSDRETRLASEQLNLGLIAVLNSVDLIKSRELERNALQEPEIPTIDDLIDLVDSFEAPKPRKEIAFEVAQRTARMMGVADADSNRAELQALWESRGRDPLALVDLFMSATTEKLKFYGRDRYLESPTVVQNLRDITERPEGENPRDLTHRQEKESIETYVSLGIDEMEIRTLFQWQGPFGSLRLRYAAWLVNQPLAEPVIREFKAAANIRRPDEEAFVLAPLFIGLLESVKDAYQDHTSPDSRRKNYDFRLGYQAAAYNTKKMNLQALYLLGLHILNRQDVERYVSSQRKTK